MAFLGIKVPSEAAHLLSEIDVAGDKTEPKELHITLMYFGDKWATSEMSKSLEVINEITQQTQPFAVTTSMVTHFPGYREGKIAVIAKMESPALHKMHKELAKKLDDDGIEYSKEFKEYRPHITLSYAEEPPKDKKIRTIEFKIEEITLWGGEDMNDKIIVSFPLAQKHRHAALLQKAELFEKIAGNPLQ